MSKQTLTKTISTLTKSEENFQKKFLKHSQDTLDQDSERQEVNDESENNICRRRKGTKRLLIMTSLVILGIGILFVVTLINVEPGSSDDSIDFSVDVGKNLMGLDTEKGCFGKLEFTPKFSQGDLLKQSRYDRHGEWEIKINGKSNKHKTEKVSVINTCCWLIYSTEDSEKPESLSPGMFDHSPRISYIKKVVSMDCT